MSIDMTVKAARHAYVVDMDGNRIPEDRYVTVPMSPGLIRAVKDGDLEEVERPGGHHPRAQQVFRRRQAETQPAPPA